MTWVRGLADWVCAVAVACACHGVSKAGPAPEPKRSVGWVLPPHTPGAHALVAGARSADSRLALVIRSAEGQWGTAGDDAARLVTEEGCAILVAPPDSATTHLVLQVAGRTRTPVIALCPDDAVVGAGIPWVLRLVPSTRDEARALLPLAADWAFVVPARREGRERARDLSVLTVGENRAGRIDILAADGGNVPEALRGYAAVALFIDPGLAGEWVRELRTGGYSGVLAGPGALRDAAFLRAAGQHATGVTIAVPAIGPESSAAREAFTVRHGARHAAEPTEFVFLGADVMGVAEALLARAGAGQPARAFPVGDLGAGATGAWRFNERGERELRMVRERWDGRRWVAEVVTRSPAR